MHSIMKSPRVEMEEKATKKLDKTKTALWTFTQVVHESLNPWVTEEESEDYARYISHPQTLPLVTSNKLHAADVDVEYLDYVNGAWGEGGLGGVNSGEDDFAELADFLTVAENPLMIHEEDLSKKRYKAYKKWLMGKSLFKQQPIE